jgi:hypothetical protein
MPPDFQNATAIFYKGWAGLMTPLVICGLVLWGELANHGKLRQRYGAVLITGGAICLAVACAFFSYEIVRMYFRPESEIAISGDGMWCRSWGNFWMPWSDVTDMTLYSRGIRFPTYTANFKFKPETVGNYPWTSQTPNVLQLSSANCNVQGLDHGEEDIYREINRTYQTTRR